MENKKTTELLCLQGKEKLYAVDFEYVAEICTEFQISSVPCFPKHFLGVSNYKGTIIPVTCLEEIMAEQTEEVENGMLLVLRCGKYILGIQLEKPPYSISTEDIEKISSPVMDEQEALWAESEIIKYENQLISVIDVEASIRKMIIFGEIE